MTRSEVYAFRTTANEASNWPYTSHALMPDDPKLREKYRDMGRLTEDGGVRIESPVDYARVCREQGVAPRGDYEKTGHTSTNRTTRKEAKAARRARLKDAVARKIRDKGVGLGD
jgi:hypothetical protein